MFGQNHSTSFIIRSFSNDCFETTHPENTLSSWTTDLPSEIDLKNERWVCGVKQIFLNPIATTNYVKTSVNDHIVLEAQVLPYTSFETFIKHIFEQALDLDLYDYVYYMPYLSKKMSWDFFVLNSSRYRPDVIKTEKIIKEKSVCVSLRPKDLFSSIEIAEMINNGHHDYLRLNSKETSAEHGPLPFESYLPTNLGSLTLLQILHLMIRDFLYIYRLSKTSNKEYLESFKKTWELKNPHALPEAGENGGAVEEENNGVNSARSRKMLKAFRYHKQMGNHLVHNMVERFIEQSMKERALNGSNSIELDQHVFVYTDLIQPQIVGSITSRLLTTISYPGVYRRDAFHHENFTNVEFAPLEKARFKSISIALKNEWGEPIDFIPSRSPNCVAIVFKRIDIPNSKI